MVKILKKEGIEMYNYYQPQVQAYQQLSYLKGRPVSSVEEARASTIDFDGSIFYFPDLANNRIYTKQINLNGTATLNVYELKPCSPELTTDYVTRGEFNEFAQKLMKQLNPSEPPKEEQKEFNFK